MSRVFVTGAGQGIGAETVLQLRELGHDVVAHARSEKRAEQIKAAHAVRAHHVGLAGVVVGDLSTMASTRELAGQANALGPYDAIIHNAGLGGGSDKRKESADGLELIFHTNVVSPYILTCLMPVAPRMVYLTSGLEAQGRLTMDDLQWKKRPWDGMQAYSDSKLHDVMLAFELAARHPGIVVNTVDPGWIKTSLGGPNAPDPLDLGAETQVWLVTSDDPIALTSGQYIKRRAVQVPNPEAQDPAKRAALVDELESLTGLVLP
ncbi:MAG: SDR family NAD(P)-dependent oxidoreductase [Demequinaceae bacterium]|nr:SDR family NAD(P)-dependent oxidoreductase [Demequinaceae bacterium]